MGNTKTEARKRAKIRKRLLQADIECGHPWGAFWTRCHVIWCSFCGLKDIGPGQLMIGCGMCDIFMCSPCESDLQYSHKRPTVRIPVIRDITKPTEFKTFRRVESWSTPPSPSWTSYCPGDPTVKEELSPRSPSGPSDSIRFRSSGPTTPSDFVAPTVSDEGSPRSASGPLAPALLPTLPTSDTEMTLAAVPQWPHVSPTSARWSPIAPLTPTEMYVESPTGPISPTSIYVSDPMDID